MKDFFYEWGALLGVIVLLLLLSMVPECVSSYLRNKEYSCLDDNISEIEELIGDYSDYYVVLDDKLNNVPHSISGTEIDDNIFLLIPSNVDESNLILDFYTCWDAKLSSYRCDLSNSNTYTVKGKDISIVKSDMQFVFIDINKSDLAKVESSFREETNYVKYKASTKVTTEGHSIDAEIKPRGASTWTLYNKLPFNLKMTRSEDLFGLGKERKLCLLANASDKTLLKNEVFFDMARDLGLKYTPKIKNVHMFFNNSYQGIYSISTRVDSSDTKSSLSDKEDFIINWGAAHWDNRVNFTSKFWAGDGEKEDFSFVDIVYPDKDMVSVADKKRVGTIVQDLVDRIDNRDTTIGDLIDLESLAKYYWIQEISMNSDAWYRSTYMYYQIRY